MTLTSIEADVLPHSSLVNDDTESLAIDIGEGEWSDLSNFTAREFIFNGIQYASMEGFLQSLKFPLVEKQARVRGMVGKQAKRIGKKKKWYLDQTLYFLTLPMDRHSPDYFIFVQSAFEAMYAYNSNFRERLASTGNRPLIHSRGQSNPHRTILTESEFIKILMRLREQKYS